MEGLVGIIDQTDPDIVLLCELERGDRQFIASLVGELGKRGKTYYPDSQYMNVGVLSKYKPIRTQAMIRPEETDRAIVKAHFDINGHAVAVYSAHLDYKHYECYLPRGYSGTTWKKIDKPVVDPDSILAANRLSNRDEAISFLIADASGEIGNDNLVIIGGDFNEPSHLDWQEDTRNLYDHNGAVVNWDCSVMLAKAGYKDAYRQKYPSAVLHPGFTFPAGNKDAVLKDLVWAPEADERDRIDFIYYHPNRKVRLEDAFIVGPSQSVAHGQFVESPSGEAIIEPTGVWPTDHKGNLVVFRIR